MSVSMDKGRTLHIHVGHNMPGYLPESDVMCFDNVADALEALRHEIKDQQDYYYESCEGHCPDCAEFEACGDSESCAWCAASGDCEAALASIADGDMTYTFLRTCYVGMLFSPPEGADVIYWMTDIRPDRKDCELLAEYDA